MTIASFIGPQEIILILLPVLLISILPIFALVDIIRNEFKGPNDKLIWVLVVIFTWLLGAFLYFLIGRNQRINTNR